MAISRGVGDFSQYHHEKVDFDEWSRRMLCYEDGRFAKDKIWCFYALNVSNRKKKQAGGGFFINSWYKDGLKSVQDIQSELSTGDTRWIDKITYFSKKIKRFRRFLASQT